MCGRGARVGLQIGVVVEQPHRDAVATKKPGAKKADRSTAGDQDSALVVGHARWFSKSNSEWRNSE
jgi:hypothetical protein